MAYLLFFDEVKYDPPTQASYWIGGIAMPMDEALRIERAANDVVQTFFGTRTLGKSTEFHGKEIYNGKGNFSGIEFPRRIALLSDLANLLDDRAIDRIYVRINPANMVISGQSPEAIAFMYFVEQVDDFLKEKASCGILFGDRDEQTVKTAIEAVDYYKIHGTGHARGRRIERIVDTPYFAQSHHSRLVQLADIYVYLLQFAHSESQGSENRQRFRQYLCESTGIKRFTKRRVWPPDRRWYR